MMMMSFQHMGIAYTVSDDLSISYGTEEMIR